LAITSSNLDEFTMVRIGSLQFLVAEGENRPDSNGLTPTDQLKAICERMHAFAQEQYRVYLKDLEPALADAGMKRVRPSELTERQYKHIETLFEQEIFPVLTPMAIAVTSESVVPSERKSKKKGGKSKSRPVETSNADTTPANESRNVTDSPVFFPSADTPSFPNLINQSLSLCVRLAPAEGTSIPRFAIVPFGRNRQRFLTLPSESGFSFILLEEVVELFLSRLFPGTAIEECVPFRITRNADVELQEDQAFDLLREMQEVVNARRQGACVRLELADRASSILRDFLVSGMDVSEEWVFAVPGPHDLGTFFRLTDSQGFDSLRYEPWPPQPHPLIDPAESIFTSIARRDLLLVHPYESFDPIVRLVDEAADDPDVLAIKQTLYRTSAGSPIVAALKRAAQKGKYVTVVVEL
ncbi:MAG: RNA degradosome polyphosphate kinase, partial [Planctomycetes bacterium]|nr:RNA degradosome polyphosphate kinase [Planctomycetota bacterium]